MESQLPAWLVFKFHVRTSGVQGILPVSHLTHLGWIDSQSYETLRLQQGHFHHLAEMRASLDETYPAGCMLSIHGSNELRTCVFLTMFRWQIWHFSSMSVQVSVTTWFYLKMRWQLRIAQNSASFLQHRAGGISSTSGHHRMKSMGFQVDAA